MINGKGKHGRKRWLSLALCLAMVFPWLGETGYAEAGDSAGLCEHHPEHTAECGYSEGRAEMPCTHVHEDSCFTVSCLLESPEAEPGHVCSLESGCVTLACAHVHDEICGYAPAVPASPCGFVCAECAAESRSSSTPEPGETQLSEEGPDDEAGGPADETKEKDGSGPKTEGEEDRAGDAGPDAGEEEEQAGDSQKDKGSLPADPSQVVTEAALEDPETGEILYRLEPGAAEGPAWPLEGSRLLRLRAVFPAAASGRWQLRLSLSPMLALAEEGPWEGALVSEEIPAEGETGRVLLIAPDPAFFPAPAESDPATEEAPAVLELSLPLTVNGELWAARLEELAEAEDDPFPRMPSEELLQLDLLWDGTALEERSTALRGSPDWGISLMSAPFTVNAAGKNFANLVIFAYFQDQADGESFFQDPANAKKLWDLYEGSSGRSVKNYISTVSYGKVQVLNVLPQYDSASGTIHAVCLSGSASTAQTQNIDTEIVREALAGVNVDGSILDLNRDGILDNVTVILKGGEDRENENSNVSYASHKSDYSGSLQAFGIQVSPYNMQNTDRVLGGGGSGVLIHEFLHTLGFSDLYNHDQTFPVDTWDIMSRSSARPSWPLAYTRKEQGWVDLTTVTASRSLTFTAPGQGDGSTQAYILQAPQNDRELFVVEMRHRGRLASEDDLDCGVSVAMNYDTSGLIVYRVDTSVRPLSNYYGSTGIYVFRPTGYGDESQNIQHAFLNAQENRTSIGLEDPDATLKQGALTFAGGANSGIVLKNIRKNDDGTMSCEVVIPSSGNYDTWEDTRFSAATHSYDKCAVVTASLQGTQYLVTYTNGVFQTYRYSGNTWSELPGASWTETSRAAPELRMIEHGGKLILGYADYPSAHLKLRELDPGAGRWRDLYTGTEEINGLELQSQGASLYIVYETAEKAGLLELSGGTVKDQGSYLTGLGGQPQQATVNGTLYVASRLASGNVIEIYRREASGAYRKISDGKIAAGNYSIAALNGKLMVVTSKDKSLTVYSYDGSQWTQGKTSPIDCFDPKLTVLQGNLYLLSASSTGGGYIYVYQYDPYTGGWVQEGLQVDASAMSITLTADQDYLYVSYVLNGSNSVCVRRKALANALLSLEVTPPSQTEYTKGEPVSTAGMVVTAHYEREDRVLREGEYVLTGFDSGTVGSRQATVSYGGKTASFSYQIKEPAAKPLDQPKLLKLEDTGSGLRLTWSPVNGAESYQVFYKTGGGPWTKLQTASGGSFLWVPPKAGTYAFTVQALSAGGKTDSSYDGTGLRIEYAPRRLTLTPPSGYTDETIYVDGRPYPAAKSGGSYSVTLPDTKGATAVMYQYNNSGVPVGMSVWRLGYQGTLVTATELKGLRDLISYHGFSIRVQAPAGIRFKSGISEATRRSLLAGGVDGYRLVEYGTLFMLDANRSTYPFVLNGEKVNSGRAYWSENGRVTDRVFEKAAGRIRFTSVLIGLPPEMYDQQLAFRGYVILSKGGENITVYGPPVSRSVYIVAQQVQNAHEFAYGSAGYQYVQGIIDSVEKKKG